MLESQQTNDETGLDGFHKVAIDADTLLGAIAFAIEQPADVAINELIVRPTVQVGLIKKNKFN